MNVGGFSPPGCAKRSSDGRAPPAAGWLVGDFQRLGHFGGAELFRRRGMGAVDRLEQFAQAGAVLRADAHRSAHCTNDSLRDSSDSTCRAGSRSGRPTLLTATTSARPASSTAPSTLASCSVTPSLASSMITATALFDRLQGLDDGELLHRLLTRPFAAQAGGVDPGGTCGRRVRGRRRWRRAWCPARRTRSSVPRRGCG